MTEMPDSSAGGQADARDVRKVVVPAPATEAFRVFTQCLAQWLPPEMGGRLYEQDASGTEIAPGTVLEWAPSRRLVMTWAAPGRPPNLDDEGAGHGEVDFRQLGPSATEVVVKCLRPDGGTGLQEALQRYATEVARQVRAGHESQQRLIAQFRAAGGSASSLGGLPLLLLTTTGAKSGLPRTVPLTYIRDGDRIVVAAANGGRAADPAWYRNLRVNPAVTVEVDADAFTATATDITGQDREALYRRFAAAFPQLTSYEGMQQRREIPLVALIRQ
jgi:deazaflavin-dependent oxidoreductase (nitroreductase family)